MKRSAESYDQGYEDEAIRLAVCLRVLLHDTSESTSLLTHLGEKNRIYWDSRAAIDIGMEKECDSCFVMVQVAGKMSKYIPVLERGPIPMLQSDFETWWNGVVIIDGKGKKITRRQLILAVANKDGGAHVSASLSSEYADLTRNNSFGWSAIDGEKTVPLKGAELAAIRQISHEILKTLDPNYAPIIPPLTGMVTGFMNPDIIGLTMEFTSPSGKASVKREGIGRNDPCFCKSGKMYKDCHKRKQR